MQNFFKWVRYYCLIFIKYSYLIPFLTSNPTENSIKVLNKIIINISVPKSYINNYIKNAITFYLKEPNKNEKIKKAKFIAFFINKLFENNIYTKDDEIYTVRVESEEVTTFEAKETPITAKIDILLLKRGGGYRVWINVQLGRNNVECIGRSSVLCIWIWTGKVQFEDQWHSADQSSDPP